MPLCPAVGSWSIISSIFLLCFIVSPNVTLLEFKLSIPHFRLWFYDAVPNSICSGGTESIEVIGTKADTVKGRR
jgi:hypothetical protein